MAHENSETVQDRTGNWINSRGHLPPTFPPGPALPPLFNFEKPFYKNMPEAVAAAQMRSDLMPLNTSLWRLLHRLVGADVYYHPQQGMHGANPLQELMHQQLGTPPTGPSMSPGVNRQLQQMLQLENQ